MMSFNRMLFPVLAVLACLSAPQGLVKSSQAESSQVLMAGAAIADITPPLGETIVGSFAPFPATNVHDPLHARCLILDNGANKIAWVICDNVGIAKSVYDQAREQIAKETNIPSENILMAATHTHSACVATKPKYEPIVVAGIVRAVKLATERMQPAKIGWGSVDEPSELFNRRWFVSKEELRTNPFGGIDQVRMNPPRGNPALVKPAGPIDPEVSFISVQSQSGRPIALLANYSLHYVGGVTRGDISADYFGIFSNEIGALIGANSDDEFVGMLTNGTSGDVNNINFRANPRENRKQYEKYEKMTEVANKVAKRVAEAHANIEFRDWVPLGAAWRELTLQVRKPDEKLKKYLAEMMAKPEDKATQHHRYERIYAERVKKLVNGPDEYVVPLQALRIGDLGITAIPFETFTEIGLQIKRESPLGDTFTIELANDSRGYLPTPEQHKLGGYETWMGTNRVEKQASVKITEQVLSMLNELKMTP